MQLFYFAKVSMRCQVGMKYIIFIIFECLKLIRVIYTVNPVLTLQIESDRFWKKTWTYIDKWSTWSGLDRRARWIDRYKMTWYILFLIKPKFFAKNDRKHYWYPYLYWCSSSIDGVFWNFAKSTNLKTIFILGI